MNFELTEERQMLQDTLRRFLKDRYTTEVRNKILDSDVGMSADIWNELAELGVIGALFTEDQGGFGGMGFDIAVVFEELGRAGVVEPFLDGALLCGRILAHAGQADKVEAIIGGTLQLALAHGEPTSRYDLNYVQTTAKGNVINGRKAVVMNAEAVDTLIVSARTSGGAADEDGITLFAVDKDAKGLMIQGYALLSGGRAAEVTLDNVEGTMIGEEGKGFALLETAYAAATVGPMRRNSGGDAHSHQPHQRVPDDAQTVRTTHRDFSGLGAPHGGPVDRNGTSDVGGDPRAPVSLRRMHAHAT